MAILVAGVGFLVLPAHTIEVGPISTDVFGSVFHFADWTNLTYNYLPSLHVAMAVLCAASYARGASVGFTVFVWAWAIAIAISTMLTRQHYVLDVVSGGLLGLVVAYALPICRLKSHNQNSTSSA